MYLPVLGGMLGLMRSRIVSCACPEPARQSASWITPALLVSYFEVIRSGRLGCAHPWHQLSNPGLCHHSVVLHYAIIPGDGGRDAVNCLETNCIVWVP